MSRRRPRAHWVKKIKAIKARRAIHAATVSAEDFFLYKIRSVKPNVPLPSMVGVSHATPVWRRIYTNERGDFFISGVNAVVDHPELSFYRLFHLDPRTMKLSHFVSALIQVRPDGVLISAVSKYHSPPLHSTTHTSDLPPRGFRVAGPIIEEAERLARNHRLPRLLLNTAGRKRIDYYKSFGFRTVGRAPIGVDMVKDLT